MPDDFFLYLLFDSEDGSYILLRNVLSASSTVLNDE
jgi:hypothetical protein